MRGFTYIGSIRDKVTKELWVLYLRKGTVYMYTADKEYRPVERVKTFTNRADIKQYIYENKNLKAFLDIFV